MYATGNKKMLNMLILEILQKYTDGFSYEKPEKAFKKDKKNLKDRKRMLLPYSSSDIYTGSMKWNDKSSVFQTGEDEYIHEEI